MTVAGAPVDGTLGTTAVSVSFDRSVSLIGTTTGSRALPLAVICTSKRVAISGNSKSVGSWLTTTVTVWVNDTVLLITSGLVLISAALVTSCAVVPRSAMIRITQPTNGTDSSASSSASFVVIHAQRCGSEDLMFMTAASWVRLTMMLKSDPTTPRSFVAVPVIAE